MALAGPVLKVMVLARRRGRRLQGHLSAARTNGTETRRANFRGLTYLTARQHLQRPDRGEPRLGTGHRPPGDLDRSRTARTRAIEGYSADRTR